MTKGDLKRVVERECDKYLNSIDPSSLLAKPESSGLTKFAEYLMRRCNELARDEAADPHAKSDVQRAAEEGFRS